MDSPRFALREVTVSPTSRVSYDEVLALAEVEEGDRLLALDTDAIAARVAEHPWVAEARVSRQLPVGPAHRGHRAPGDGGGAAGGAVPAGRRRAPVQAGHGGRGRRAAGDHRARALAVRRPPTAERGRLPGGAGHRRRLGQRAPSAAAAGRGEPAAPLRLHGVSAATVARRSGSAAEITIENWRGSIRSSKLSKRAAPMEAPSAWSTWTAATSARSPVGLQLPESPGSPAAGS